MLKQVQHDERSVLPNYKIPNVRLYALFCTGTRHPELVSGSDII